MRPVSTHYLREVLGVQNYLCPKTIRPLRNLKGSLPCETLIIISEPLNTETHSLLKKIMKALDRRDFSLLEIKDSSQMENFKNAILLKTPARKILIFSKKFSSFFKDSHRILTACDLKDLLQTESGHERKRALWSRLKKWTIPDTFSPL